MFGLGDFFNSFGMIPDIMMGKDPRKALQDNLTAVALASAGMSLPNGLLSSAMSQPAAPQASGLLDGALKTLDTYGKPVATGLQIANQAKQLAASNPMQMPQMMPIQSHDPIGQMLAQQAQLEELRRKARYGLA